MMMVVVMTADVVAAVVIIGNLINCMLGGSMFGDGSFSGLTIGFGCSFLAHHHPHHYINTKTNHQKNHHNHHKQPFLKVCGCGKNC